MIIDCHTHLGRSEHITATADDLIISMDEAGVDKALVFAGLKSCTNKWVKEQTAPYADRLFRVASVNMTDIIAQPGTTGASTDDMSLCDMLETLNDGAVALKLYTGYEYFAPNSERVRHVLDLVAKYTNNKAIIFHTGDCLSSMNKAKLKYAQPLDVDDIAVDYPDFNFIIAHMGYPWVTTAAEVCYKNPNVYADISGFVYGKFSWADEIQFKKTINKFLRVASCDKLLFGSDFPIANQKSYVDTMKTLFGRSECPPPDLAENAKKAFNL